MCVCAHTCVHVFCLKDTFMPLGFGFYIKEAVETIMWGIR